MTLKRKTIELIEVGPEFCLDSLYANENYDEPFVIETKCGEVHTVSLAWEQGHGNNYRFVKGSDVYGYNGRDIIWPDRVAMIEVR